MAAPKKRGVDLAVIFGGGGPKKSARADAEPMGDEGEEPMAEDGPSAAYESAYKEWEAEPGPETMWRMIKACYEAEG